MKFLKASLIVSVLMLAGRASGFARDWYLGWVYGANLHSDLAILVLTVPDLLVNIVLGGGVAAALVPEFRRLSSARAAGLLIQSFLIIVSSLAIIAAFAALFSKDLMMLMAPGLPESAIDQGRRYFSWALVAVPLSAGSGALAAWLDAHGKFPFSASGTVVFNSSVLLAMVLFSQSGLLFAVTVGVLSGGLIRLGFQGGAAIRAVAAPPSFHRINYSAIVGRFSSAFLFSSFLAALPAIARAFASQHDVGSLSIFSYVLKVIELPMTLAVSAIAVVLLPRLATQFEQNDGGATASAALSLRAVSLLCIGLAIPAVFFPDAIFRAIFFSGVFTQEQRLLMSSVFVTGVVFLPIRAVMVVSLPILAAAGRAGQIAVAGVVLILVFIGMAFMLIGPFSLVGVMLAMSISMSAASIYMVVSVARHLGKEVFRLWFAGFHRSFVLPAIASLAICSLGPLFGADFFAQIGLALLSFLVFLILAFGPHRDIWLAGAITLGKKHNEPDKT